MLCRHMFERCCGFAHDARDGYDGPLLRGQDSDSEDGGSERGGGGPGGPKLALFSPVSFFLTPDGEKLSAVSKPQLDQLKHHVPSEISHEMWHLVYSFSDNGVSLNALWSVMQMLEHALLVVKTMSGATFGAYLARNGPRHTRSGSLHADLVRKHTFGESSSSFTEEDGFTGSSFLFSFDHGSAEKPDEPEIYRWTGQDRHFVMVGHDVHGEASFLAFGVPFGLWLDDQLQTGTSAPCATYGNNMPLVRHSPDRFYIAACELWSFEHKFCVGLRRGEHGPDTHCNCAVHRSQRSLDHPRGSFFGAR